MPSPLRPTDDEARALARDLIARARSVALGVIDLDGGPMVSRIAFGVGATGEVQSLVSDLSRHTRALRANPLCSLLIGEPGARGDPLTHPRLTLQARARFTLHDHPDYAKMAAHYLRDHPKAKLYIGFADFSFVSFQASRGHLNGGFGKAFTLAPDDLGLPC